MRQQPVVKVSVEQRVIKLKGGLKCVEGEARQRTLGRVKTKFLQNCRRVVIADNSLLVLLQAVILLVANKVLVSLICRVKRKMTVRVARILSASLRPTLEFIPSLTYPAALLLGSKS
jgi:hypothetical protein